MRSILNFFKPKTQVKEIQNETTQNEISNINNNEIEGINKHKEEIKNYEESPTRARRNEALDESTDGIEIRIYQRKKPEVIKKRAKQNRKHHYFCLLPHFNIKIGSNSCFKVLTGTIFAYPAYFCLLLFIFLLIIVALICYFSYLLVYTRTVNNSYFSKCTSNNDCNSLVGLGCSAENQVCNCPAGYIKGRCDCSRGTYWDGVRCSPWMQYKQAGCAGDYNCDPTKELKCVNQACVCVPPKYWNSTANTCDFAFLGCFSESTGTGRYYIGALNTFRRMFYIVDMCTSYCRNINNNYSLIYTYGDNLNYCWCLSALASPTPITCDVQCLGKNGKSYWCGNSGGAWFHRAIYLS